MWDGVNFKLESAGFFSQEMSSDLIHPRHNAQSQLFEAIMVSTGAIVSHPWQDRFYYHLDAFLAATRSIPDIIQSCFGKDPKVDKSWFSALDPDERKRREDFQSSFANYYLRFNKLPLSRARVVTLHRLGVPPVEVKIAGRWGIEYIGGPVARVPSAESMPVAAGRDPALLWAATQPPLPVQPGPDDFDLTLSSGAVKKLFPECGQYLQEARNLVEKAKEISQREHGGKKLTAPPAG
jgi:hypothetical protein